jgi:nucleoside-diphosphate-sugar epimerase
MAGAGTTTVLGGTGFVGRALAEAWDPPRHGTLRLLVHRGRPGWLDGVPAEVRTTDLASPADLRASLDGASACVNLLRPDGSGWLRDAMPRIVEALRAGGTDRLIHASSIDVYGCVPQRDVSEDVPTRPATPYEREHAALEEAVSGSARPVATVLRLGAVFGAGGRNLRTLADEAARAPAWRIAARRAVSGRRRMNLVPVETVAAAFLFCLSEPRTAGRTFNVCDDDDDANDFRTVHDEMLAGAGRRVPPVPELPAWVLDATLRLRGRSNADSRRRFPPDALRALGFRPPVRLLDAVRRFACGAAG